MIYSKFAYRVILCCLFFGTSFYSPVLFAEERSDDAKVYSFTITVPDADEGMNALVSLARARKGVVIFYSPSRVEFRVPASGAESCIESIRSSGYVTDESTSASDVGEQSAVIRSQINVKKEYLSRLYALTEESDLGGTLTAEQEIEKAIAETDRLKSSLRTLERQKKFAQFTIYLSGPQFGQEKVYSRWPFVNALGIDNLVQEN